MPNIGKELLTEHASYDSVINAGNRAAQAHIFNVGNALTHNVSGFAHQRHLQAVAKLLGLTMPLPMTAAVRNCVFDMQ